MELRMSSVCVSGCFASTGGSFLPPLAPLAPLLLVVSSEGVSYLTSDDNGAPGMATVQQSRTVGWAGGQQETVQSDNDKVNSHSPVHHPRVLLCFRFHRASTVWRPPCRPVVRPNKSLHKQSLTRRQTMGTPSSTATSFSWGRGRHGVLGDGTAEEGEAPPSSPRIVAGPLNGRRISQLCCGELHTLALTAEAGAVFSWGSGLMGALGHGGRSNGRPSTRHPSRARQSAAFSTCLAPHRRRAGRPSGVFGQNG